jgi:hypothetical protein
MRRMDLSEKHKSWLIREQVIAPAAIAALADRVRSR